MIKVSGPNVPSGHSVSSTLTQREKQTPKEIPQVVPNPPSQENKESKSGLISLPGVLDSFIRGLARYVETIAFNNPLIRIPFRFVTELLRFGTSGSLQNVIENKKVNKKIWIESAKKAFVTSCASGLIDSNRFDNRFFRVGAGFANMLIRFAANITLVALNFMDPKEIKVGNLLDEFVSRSALRAIYVDSTNPFIGIGIRTLEQLGINTFLEKLPIKSYLLPRLKNDKNKHS